MPPFPAPEEQFDPYSSRRYESIDTLNDDVLLIVFNLYRLYNEINWNTRLGWCNLSQYDASATLIDAQDELGIFHALQLRDRLRRVVLCIPPSILDQLLLLMGGDEPFPALSHLSLSSSAEEGTILLLPKTLLAPNLRHLTLIPRHTYTRKHHFGYFIPQHLIARLRSFSQLEELSIGFSVPIPRPSTEGELLQDMEAPVTLPLLKCLTFRGVSVYFDSFVAQIRAPLLEQLNITLFNQLHFALPHLSHFTNDTEGLRLPIAKIIFNPNAVSIVTYQHEQQPSDGSPSCSLHVMCRQFDWQIDSAAQICSALVATLFGIEQLSLEFEGQGVSAEWQDNAVDAATWRELLGPFTGVRKLRICRALSWELSCALQSAEIGSDPGILPSLEELAAELEEEHADNAFMSFIEARQSAGRPVLLSVPRKQSILRKRPIPRIESVPLPATHKPRLARRVFPWTKDNSQRKYIDLIKEVTSKWANWNPPRRIHIGDFGTIDKNTGEFLIEGNIFSHPEIKHIAQDYPALEVAETDLYQVHSYHVRKLDVQADVGVSTAADDQHVALKSRWQFNNKRGAILLMHRPRLICLLDSLFAQMSHLPMLKNKEVARQVYNCPGFYMYLSNKIQFDDRLIADLYICPLLASEQVTVSLRSGASARASTDQTLASTGWSTDGATGISQYAYREDAVYTPLFCLRSLRKRILRR
ncbi:hypothetical protein V8E53_010045 [Lactarius tabidus]